MIRWAAAIVVLLALRQLAQEAAELPPHLETPPPPQTQPAPPQVRLPPCQPGPRP